MAEYNVPGFLVGGQSWFVPTLVCFPTGPDPGFGIPDTCHNFSTHRCSHVLLTGAWVSLAGLRDAETTLGTGLTSRKRTIVRCQKRVHLVWYNQGWVDRREWSHVDIKAVLRSSTEPVCKIPHLCSIMPVIQGADVGDPLYVKASI